MTAAALPAAGAPRRRTPCEDDPDKWFAEEGSADARQAKKACRACHARLPCLSLAVATGEKFGIWGGLTPSERGRGPSGEAAAAPRRPRRRAARSPATYPARPAAQGQAPDATAGTTAASALATSGRVKAGGASTAGCHGNLPAAGMPSPGSRSG
jgi:hypothetical protein